eukprot:TRINITY_DN46_c0_g1_i4.p1 TRINITY_DN46_c0_g1~~TRINITY_DN46_c0_g1_i4.p1  ORF type:complete len:153 (-),score=15.72 TRINITY_DN46_c0_g1_i4:144-602(-)
MERTDARTEINRLYADKVGADNTIVSRKRARLLVAVHELSGKERQELEEDLASFDDAGKMTILEGYYLNQDTAPPFLLTRREAIGFICVVICIYANCATAIFDILTKEPWFIAIKDWVQAISGIIGAFCLEKGIKFLFWSVRNGGQRRVRPE